MTLFNFALNNIRRDKQNYIYYFINCLFSVLIFFLFSVLASHPSLHIIDEGSTMKLILNIGQIIAVAFAFVFIAYSVNGFLKMRSNQFGIITLIGASKKQLNRLIFIENAVVGLLAIGGGIVIGMIFSKLFLDLASKMIGNVEFYFYFPLKAILLTVGILGVLFLLIAYLTPKRIQKEKIINLVKNEQKGEKPQKLYIPTIVFGIIGSVVLWGYFSRSEMAKVMIDSQILLIPLAITIVLGIYLLLSYGMRFSLRIAHKKGTYYKGTHMIFMSDVMGKRKENCIGMTLTAILYTISFFTVIVLWSQSGNVVHETNEIIPYAVQYAAWDETQDVQQDLAVIKDELQYLDHYKEIEIRLYAPLESSRRKGIMKESDYNTIMDFLGRDKINIKPNQVYLVSGDAGRKQPTEVPIELIKLFTEKGMQVDIKGSSNRPIMLSGYTTLITVVDDLDFEKIINNLKEHFVYGFDFPDKYNNSKIGQVLDKKFERQLEESRIGLVFAYDYFRTTQLQNDLMLYIGAILSFSFMVAVTSFIFSRLYSSLEKDAEKLGGIVKTGLSKRELNKILSYHVKMLLFIPFLISISCMWVGVLWIEESVIVSNIPVAVICTFILMVLQGLYYLIVMHFYKRRMHEQIYQK